MPLTSKGHRVYKIPKNIKLFHLLILGLSIESKIPMKPLIRERHDICKIRILVTTKVVQFWKCLSKSTTPTPQVMPKFNSITIANFEDDGFKESQPALSYSSPQTNTISSCYFFSTPSTLNIPILDLNNPLPKVVNIYTVPPQPFTNESLVKFSQISHIQPTRLLVATYMGPIDQIEFMGLINTTP